MRFDRLHPWYTFALTWIYQASTSELYSLPQEIPQEGSKLFRPRSPYGVAKLYAYWITVNVCESCGMYACNGVLFNHDGPRRDETSELHDGLTMGNFDSLRDWGHARDDL